MLPFIILSSLAALAQSAPSTLDSRASSTLDKDLKVLEAFAKTVDGPSNITANWTAAGSDLCAWAGVVCDDKGSSVIGIDFNQDHLKGDLKLGGLLEKLTSLQFFHVNSNAFAGTLPDLSKVKDILELDVSNNKLSGSFPEKIFTAPQLTFVDFRFNSFSGNLPSKLFTAFKKIDVLFLNDNKFSGSLPSELGKFPGRYLTFANNGFTGSLPSELADMKNLNEVLFLNNKLTGSLPSGLGKLENLTVFDVSDNELSGTVPEELCAIKSLEILVLKGNKFEGKLGPKCKASKKAGILQI